MNILLSRVNERLFAHCNRKAHYIGVFFDVFFIRSVHHVEIVGRRNDSLSLLGLSIWVFNIVMGMLPLTRGVRLFLIAVYGLRFLCVIGVLELVVLSINTVLKLVFARH